ncbi:hypothetical protein M407DRAFT_33221 [Tulasnella calospora MUT 4182]|uniref:Uncharacterized protein n=1 Tax=Tulasnella calospora MUT 4182 TaxID=1051891 RepID=A0A0C3Q3E9_9AGAM|nr:hypothetical protein M407DRAFT_33221 [Tulasnella calospora MUT 4182]
MSREELREHSRLSNPQVDKLASILASLISFERVDSHVAAGISVQSSYAYFRDVVKACRSGLTVTPLVPIEAIASILKMKKILDEEKQQQNIQSKIEKFENLFNIAHPKMVLPYRHPDWAVEMGSLAHEFDNISSLSTDDDDESRWLHRLAFASLISTGFEAWSCHILPYMLNLRERLLHTAGHSVR